MSIKYTPDAACFDAANNASGQRLTREEIEHAFQRMFDYKTRLQETGNIDGMADKLRTFAEKEAERTKIAAAMQRRHAALNIIVRDKLDATLEGFAKAGMTPKQAMLAILEGTQKSVQGGRNSVSALKLAYEARYHGGMFAELQRTNPALIHMLQDQRFDADVMREMGELREGGRPGITGNRDAQVVAKVFSTYAELARTDLNRLGASIGKLDGWSGAQTHDDVKMIEAGKNAWVDFILPKLDLARTFPDAATEQDVLEALDGIYDTLITGVSNKVSAKEKGQRVNPANLAKSLGKSRVLHFKNADAALAYRDRFGYGNLTSGMINHLRNSARMAALMETLGPNPENMFNAVVETLKRQVKNDSSLAPKQVDKLMKGLVSDAGALRQAFDIASGLVSRPVDATWAKIGSDIRAVESMAKLGGATISAFADNITAAAAAQFRGSGFLKGLVQQIGGMMRGRPKGEQAEIAYLLGEGFDGLIGHIVSPAAAYDGPIGKLSKIQETFFKWNGLTWWTDVGRATAARVISAEMGMRLKKSFDALPANYRHVLGLHDIGEAEWKALQQLDGREVNGKRYITPHLARSLSDEAVKGLGKTADDARRNLELTLARFFADETNYGVIETDARSRRTSTLGTRPGTITGEALRFIMQFKGFPIAFSQRVLGRALFGQRAGATLAERGAHIGSLLAGLAMAGYMSMSMKDLMRGYWPPRDMSDPKTWMAAMAQGGAFGLYGDYLFSQVSRFGNTALESAAGPTIGTVSSLVNIALEARSAAIDRVTGEKTKFPAAEALSLAVNSTPFVNLFYARPALDYLFLNSMREMASPGYTRRQLSRRRTEFGQKSFLPATMH